MEPHTYLATTVLVSTSERSLKEISRYFAWLLTGPVLIIVGLVVDSGWHAAGHGRVLGTQYLPPGHVINLLALRR